MLTIRTATSEQACEPDDLPSALAVALRDRTPQGLPPLVDITTRNLPGYVATVGVTSGRGVAWVTGRGRASDPTIAPSRRPATFVCPDGELATVEAGHLALDAKTVHYVAQAAFTPPELEVMAVLALSWAPEPSASQRGLPERDRRPLQQRRQEPGRQAAATTRCLFHNIGVLAAVLSTEKTHAAQPQALSDTTAGPGANEGTA